MKEFSFYLVTDTHYFAPSLGAEGEEYENYMKTEQYFLAQSSDIVRSVFARIAANTDTNTVIIPGDLSKNGEKRSHMEFTDELRKLREAGKTVYVITAGHDYNDSPCGYRQSGRVPVEGTSFGDLYSLYYDFGLSQALSVHTRTHSYAAEVAPGIRMLAINCDSNRATKGTVDEDMLRWMKEQTDSAKEDGCFLFAICHYPIIPPLPAFDLVGDARLKNWRELASFLADNGVHLALTGHMHIQSINEFTSKNGNRLVDICTATLVGSPAKYRRITLSEDGTVKVESIPVGDFGGDMKGLSPQEFFDAQFSQAIVNRINRALSGGEGTVKKLKSFGKKRFNTMTAGSLARLAAVRIDPALTERKLTDLISEIGIHVFSGEKIYTAGHPIHEALKKVLKRYGFIIRRVEAKLEKDDIRPNLSEMLLESLGRSDGIDENNTVIHL